MSESTTEVAETEFSSASFSPMTIEEAQRILREVHHTHVDSSDPILMQLTLMDRLCHEMQKRLSVTTAQCCEEITQSGTDIQARVYEAVSDLNEAAIASNLNQTLKGVSEHSRLCTQVLKDVEAVILKNNAKLRRKWRNFGILASLLTLCNGLAVVLILLK